MTLIKSHIWLIIIASIQKCPELVLGKIDGSTVKVKYGAMESEEEAQCLLERVIQEEIDKNPFEKYGFSKEYYPSNLVRGMDTVVTTQYVRDSEGACRLFTLAKRDGCLYKEAVEELTKDLTVYEVSIDDFNNKLNFSTRLLFWDREKANATALAAFRQATGCQDEVKYLDGLVLLPAGKMNMADGYITTRSFEIRVSPRFQKGDLFVSLRPDLNQKDEVLKFEDGVDADPEFPRATRHWQSLMPESTQKKPTGLPLPLSVGTVCSPDGWECKNEDVEAGLNQIIACQAQQQETNLKYGNKRKSEEQEQSRQTRPPQERQASLAPTNWETEVKLEQVPLIQDQFATPAEQEQRKTIAELHRKLSGAPMRPPLIPKQEPSLGVTASGISSQPQVVQNPLGRPPMQRQTSQQGRLQGSQPVQSRPQTPMFNSPMQQGQPQTVQFLNPPRCQLPQTPMFSAPMQLGQPQAVQFQNPPQHSMQLAPKQIVTGGIKGHQQYSPMQQGAGAGMMMPGQPEPQESRLPPNPEMEALFSRLRQHQDAHGALLPGQEQVHQGQMYNSNQQPREQPQRQISQALYPQVNNDQLQTPAQNQPTPQRQTLQVPVNIGALQQGPYPGMAQRQMDNFLSPDWMLGPAGNQFYNNSQVNVVQQNHFHNPQAMGSIGSQNVRSGGSTDPVRRQSIVDLTQDPE
ncbi:hypothetical protein BJ508DRAFT_376493 [Ascobolus immersus RN42]|uniref:Uncharacterized protein n=1 Tax=Ascobolus immersus RN42 TaxID=1160509 RepID=A0A3N4I9N8_ASCIM|nr:hypothetical protein BJ508DRAFT_376493 [Ascobolus immersus RN42]